VVKAVEKVPHSQIARSHFNQEEKIYRGAEKEKHPTLGRTQLCYLKGYYDCRYPQTPSPSHRLSMVKGPWLKVTTKRKSGTTRPHLSTRSRQAGGLSFSLRVTKTRELNKNLCGGGWGGGGGRVGLFGWGGGGVGLGGFFGFGVCWVCFIMDMSRFQRKDAGKTILSAHLILSGF